jgi:murein L,D-transpeptidase YafK
MSVAEIRPRRSWYLLRSLIAAGAALGLLGVLDRQIPELVAETPPPAETIVVEKVAARLFRMRDGRPYRSDPIALGANPRGHKQRPGGGRTREGRYVIDERRDDTQHYKALRISYPNAEDRRLATACGEDPGSMIMVHGQPNGMGWVGWFTRRFNWTNGCIGVGSVAMEEIWWAVGDGTPIETRPRC